MKKIVFSNLPMKKEMHSLHYKVDGNSTIEYSGSVYYPVNAVLAKTLKKDDQVKVVLLSKDDKEGNSSINAGLFQKELNDINREIGASIEYVIISTPYIETREIHENLLRKLIDKLEDGAEIYSDVTYGPKSLPIIMFNALNFAEKFFKCSIKNIVYGKVEFLTGQSVPANPEIFDLTPLYYLNSLTNSMNYKDSKSAVTALDALLNI